MLPQIRWAQKRPPVAAGGVSEGGKRTTHRQLADHAEEGAANVLVVERGNRILIFLAKVKRFVWKILDRVVASDKTDGRNGVVVATVVTSLGLPLTPGFIVEGDDFSKAEEAANKAASGGIKCCIEVSGEDGRVSYWGPKGIEAEPHWY